MSITCSVVLSFLGELWVLLLLEVGTKATLSVDWTVESLSYKALVEVGRAVTISVAVCVVSAGSVSRRTNYFKSLKNN